MKENVYDKESFFEKYGEMLRSKEGLKGAGEWPTLEKILPDFEGKRTQFTLPLDFDQNYLDPEKRPSLFRKKVWHALCAIPYGGTRSYAHIARNIRNPNAVRAVGGAANANPFIIVIPCHRVINADGSIGGYAGGVMAKKYLLALEAQRTSVDFVRTQ